jgi:hypothetical protein
MFHNECECNCGYVCGRGTAKGCEFDSLDNCVIQHYVKDCRHDFTGPIINRKFDGALVYEESLTCKVCRLPMVDHDAMVGP